MLTAVGRAISAKAATLVGVNNKDVNRPPSPN
jgi:hypothetical protein